MREVVGVCLSDRCRWIAVLVLVLGVLCVL